MKRFVLRVGVLLALVPLAAPAAKHRRDLEPNGPQLNGTDLGAPRALRGASLKEGVTLADGRLLRGVTLEGTALRGPGAESFVGAMLAGQTTDRAEVRLRLEAIAPSPDPNPATAENENADVWLYTVSYQLGRYATDGHAGRTWTPAGEFAPLCPKGEPAVALAGRWDYHQGEPGDSGRLSSERTEVSFACRTAAMAKCVLWGYKPWRKGLDGLHQACVRAVRADYCGTGESMTTPGREINIYDSLSIKRDTADWLLEAEWTAKGARCLSSTRLDRTPDDDKLTVRTYVERTCHLRPCVEARAAAAPAGEPILRTEHAH